MKYALIDAANLFHRAHHVCRGDAYTKAGMALHIIFTSLRKVWHEHKIDHMVIVGEGRSWRYDYYPQYKAKRVLARKTATPAEQEEQEVFREILSDLMEYFSEKTSLTMLQSRGCEGDDLIARWIQLHPDDEHVIVSADSDNIQLLAPNVSIFDGVQNRRITMEGVFNEDNEPCVFRVDPGSGKLKVEKTFKDAQKEMTNAAKEELKKAKDAEKAAGKALIEAQRAAKGAEMGKESVLAREAVEAAESALAKAKIAVMGAEQKLNEKFEFKIDPDWYRRALFIKIIRGDTGDGIFSSYPGVRYTSKSKVGILECWEDRHEKGFHWNNFMLTKWEKLTEGDSYVDVKVGDEYAINEMLIDLTKQPQEIKDLMDTVIVDAVQKKPVGSVGIHFMKFCKKHDLMRLAERAADHAAYLNARYLP